MESRLKYLSLSWGNFSANLTQLVGPKTFFPGLRTFILERVTGLTNTDLSAFFELTARTLEYIKIVGCQISKEVGEELACDSNVHRMEQLKRAEIQNEIITLLFLARKKPCKEHRRDSKCCHITASSTSGREIEHEAQEQEILLAKALEVTGFGSIYIEAYSDWYDIYDHEDWSSVESVAKERGIKLEVESPCEFDLYD
jgi:hypothetical protein